MFDRFSFFDLSKYKMNFGIVNFLDILILGLIVYWVFVLVKDTRAGQLIKGILVLMFANFVSDVLDLHAVNYVLSGAMQVGWIALIIVFQPELRNMLERIGRKGFIKTIFGMRRKNSYDYKIESSIQTICNACHIMSERKIGALIVIELDTKITDIINTGISLNSNISSQLLVSIFTPNTPLHDGAVVIRQWKIASASCFLPLTQSTNLDSEMGTRHRAGLGISEQSDCISIIISEETGKITVIHNGKFINNLTSVSLVKLLKTHFLS